MTKNEFINHAIGKPWVNRATGPNSYDCWGLVIASFRDIDGIELPKINGYMESECGTDLAAKEGKQFKCYEKSTGIEGDIVCIYNENGDFVHVGRLLNGRVLHAWGQGCDGTGQVKWDRIELLKRLFNRVEFGRYAINS